MADGEGASIAESYGNRYEIFTYSWISQIEVYLNDKQVVDLSTPSYAYKAFIENFLSFSLESLEF